MDGLRSVVALSNAAGSIVESYSYDVFGQPSSASSVGNPYLFTGRRFDTETGLYYYRFRDYKPDIGRFLQPDPIGYYYSMNLYEYYGNNPLVFPLGFWRDLWKAKGIIGYGITGIGTAVIIVATSPAWVTAGGVIAVGGVALIVWDIIDTGEMLKHPPGEEAFKKYRQRLDDLMDYGLDGIDDECKKSP